MYQWCLQSHAEGPEKKRELEAHPDNPRSFWSRPLGETENAFVKVHCDKRTWPYEHHRQASDPTDQGNFAVQWLTVAYFDDAREPVVLNHSGYQDVRWVLQDAQRKHGQKQWKGFFHLF